MRFAAMAKVCAAVRVPTSAVFLVAAGCLSPPALNCTCEDPSAIGVTADGDASLAAAFLAAYARTGEALGCPFDAGGTAYVHEVRGVPLQDFWQDQPGCATSDVPAAVVYNVQRAAAWTVEGSFAQTFRCLASEGAPNAGPALLGAPLADAYDRLGQGWQDFETGHLWEADGIVHVSVNDGVLTTATESEATAGCALPIVVDHWPAAPPLAVVYPAGGETFRHGEEVVALWVSIPPVGAVTLAFRKGPKHDCTDALAVTFPPTADLGQSEPLFIDPGVFATGNDWYLCVTADERVAWSGYFEIAEALAPDCAGLTNLLAAGSTVRQYNDAKTIPYTYGTLVSPTEDLDQIVVWLPTALPEGALRLCMDYEITGSTNGNADSSIFLSMPPWTARWVINRTTLVGRHIDCFEVPAGDALSPAAVAALRFFVLPDGYVVHGVELCEP